MYGRLSPALRVWLSLVIELACHVIGSLGKASRGLAVPG
jgi:hypothetical protein